MLLFTHILKVSCAVTEVFHTGRIYFHRLPRVSGIINGRWLMYRFVLIYGFSERI